ncbi:MAG: ornithine cyclodeaminase family protein [Candidatus Altiarchaeota archaeon]|nr:ornithine cyclodeaminase family protein [Candidatus Altiarchaeota archaeon]
MLLIKKSELQGLLSMEEAINAVEEAFKKHAIGKSVCPSKIQFVLPGQLWKWWAFMPCYIEGIGMGVKVVSDYPSEKTPKKPTISATSVLCDESSGDIKAVMDGAYLTALRTGAIGGIAAKYLSRKDSEVVGLIGCGVQGRMQLEGVKQVREIKRVLVSDVNKASIASFKKDMEARLKVSIEETSVQELAKNSDIIITATSSRAPVLLGEWVGNGTHITSVGAHTSDARELDYHLIKKSKVVIDSQDALKSGDLKNPLEDFFIKADELTEIKDVINGKRIRKDIDDITLFKTVGTALQDVAVSALAYKKAKATGLGTEIDLGK